MEDNFFFFLKAFRKGINNLTGVHHVSKVLFGTIREGAFFSEDCNVLKEKSLQLLLLHPVTE